MTAVTVRKEDRLPLYLGGKIIVYNAKSLNKHDEVGGSRSKKTYSRGRISIALIICYIIFLFYCLLLCFFSESSAILSFFLSRPLPILLCPESTHHFSALSTPCKHDDGGGDDDDDDLSS